ncbi:MAG: NIL domain-containing protein [Spirochaetota bacterium]|nr:NIL domain-containing protein [Spirochaetota bacterium]
MVTIEVELTIPNELKADPFFYYIIKHFNVIPNIVEASFSTEMGWAIVQIQGEREELDKLFNYFTEKDVQVDFR